MRNCNLFAVILLLLILIGCGGGKTENKSLFTFDEAIVKNQYLSNESLILAIKNSENKVVDSVAYFYNDKKIGSKKALEKMNFDLKTEKCGDKNLKAIVYFDGKNEEVKWIIEVVSDIAPKLLNYKVVNTYPHDIFSFTEGLEFFRDTLYESSGLYKKSKLLKTDYKTGKILKSVTLEDQYFAEGISVLNNKLYQLTWREKTGFIYNVNTLKLEKTFKYDKDFEGWGLTNDGKNLYQNDSTENIYKLNPENLKVVDKISVYTGNQKVVKLNELEWIDGKLYSNIWQKDAIAVINPENGKVEGILNLADLRKNIKNPDAEVLNGIAYNPRTKTIFVTGKFWDKMFEIKLLD